MPTTTVRAHPRRGTRGVRRHPRRYLTDMQIEHGAGQGVGRGGFDSELLARGLAEGYAARGPWEVEREGSRVTLMHYAFPIASARIGRDGRWRVDSLQGRPGFGPSRTDRDAMWGFTNSLLGYGHGMEIPKTGQNSDTRLRGARGMGSRVSPYAEVDAARTAYREMAGMSDMGAAYRLGRRFPARRGMRTGA